MQPVGSATDQGSERLGHSGLKPTHTPAVLLARGASRYYIGAVAGLRPPHERVKAFRLLVRLLGVADGRRRQQCRAGLGDDPCGHDWHRLGPASPGGNRLG
ncbi:DUF5958 family protein [Streptacidiphilus anmyonensis]|uniref:DUF5958 family protein n=1 Tax=Streptacidiphilus anmyonensis TaxID=405782 RepID=UPI000693F8F5|nr:DUF5958 family protein [Streptacidiphilus anmyonensis]